MDRRLFVVGGLAYLAGKHPALATETADYCAQAIDLEFLTLINNYRRSLGLVELRLSQTLGGAAEHKAVDMGTTGYLQHGFQDGTTWSQNIANHGYTHSGRGENIAWGYWTAQDAFNAWRGSPTHDENMRWSSFRAIGIAMRIGYVYGADHPWPFWATAFGSTFDVAGATCGSSPTSTPPPTIVVTPTPTRTATAPVTVVPTPTQTNTPVLVPTPTATERAKKCRGRGNPDCIPGTSVKAVRDRGK